MPGYNPQAVANNARNSNTVLVAIGGVTIAFAQTVNHSISMGAEQLYGVGSPKPQEVQQLRMSPTISVDTFALTQTGVTMLANGQMLPYILAGNALDIYVLDGLNGDSALYVYTGCKCGSFSEAISSNTPIRDAYSFQALDVLDPNGNSIMNTGENALAVASTGAQALSNSLGFNA